MATFKFTSPEGTEYFGEGTNESEAFSNAREMSAGEVAAMRTRQAVKPSAGRQEGEFTQELENFMVPGLGAAKSAMRGDYGEAAGEAIMSAAPYAMGRIPNALKAGGALGAGLFAPTATAAESKFPFITDPQERQAADMRYQNIREYSEDKKTGRKVPDRELTAKARDAFFGEQQQLAKDRAENLAEQQDFDERNKGALEKLSPEEKEIYESITVPGNPGQTRAQKSQFLRETEEARKRFTMTWAEKHPQEMEYLQMGAAGVSIVAPIYQSWRRALGLNKTAREAEDAFVKSVKARAPKSAKEELAWRTNLAEELSKVNDPGFLRAVAKSALIGGTVSSAATQGPNFVDWARLPPGEARDKARAAALDPEAYGRSALEGGLGAAAGRGLSEKFGALPAARARNEAIVRTVREGQEGQAIKSERARVAAGARRTAAAAAKQQEAEAMERRLAVGEEKVRAENEKMALAKALRAGGAGSALKQQSPLAPQTNVLSGGGP